MDGLEATRKIRALAGFQDLPIIAMTANAFDDDRRACLEAGMNDFVFKPVEPEQLFATILKWLANRVREDNPPIDSLAKQPQSSRNAEPPRTLDFGNSSALLARTARLLESNDTSVILWVQTCAPALRNRLGPQFVEFERHVKAFAFEEALKRMPGDSV